ncbi:NADPH dehydrogenase NamA [Thermosediminibacter litoriperuensis]|uniref:NADPH2 dehydrogenase n=1 Tax=Thermosediminibacter litoriperuensis TaxID=291989 RepID=A0A5S5AQ40_9FIRM|nr:NADPH dehydrogenase NamA [Thermosediminibacter litoriperuensis]TYP52463.1 NADPH2 dehydrogenase [Thermosediminibacter litoriperuensis]
MSRLFSKIKIKDMEVRNRIVMPPMCMYSSDDRGFPNSWHLIHYATRAIGGVGLIIMEATAVERRGRISARDLGIWNDSHIEGLAKIAAEVKKYGAKIGIQLAHAGRKCSAPGEDLIAPSPIAFDETYGVPREMTEEDIKEVVSAFKAAALRAYRAGFDLIEIHGAHGYLISEYLSPLTNRRTDEYGGSIENRARFLKEVIKAVREVWPEEKPLMVRVSAEDYAEGGNHDIDLADIINLVKGEGVDIIDVSSGAVVPAKINAYPGYQVRFAETIRKVTGLPVIAGGLITVAEMAEEILQNERADMVYLGRELLRNPYWPLNAAKQLGDDIEWPEQYERSKK